MLKKISHVLLFILLASLFSACSHYGSRSAALPETTNKTAKRIHAALSRYERLANVSWPAIHVANLPLKPQTTLPAVAKIRHRLALLGDLPKSADNQSPLYDEAVEYGVRQFQWRHGLKDDGMVGDKTLVALNMSPRQRLEKLKLNMQRWAKFPEDEGSHYIMVNPPAFRMSMIKAGRKVMDMKIIVGKPTRPTPELYSKIQTIVFNPKWNVPRSIARKDIIPKIIENPNYLEENNIQIYTSWKKNAMRVDPKTIDWKKAKEQGFPYRFTQAPGDLNALGRIKFVFMNNHDVYMHDTPQKGLFNEIARAFSSGCIRLEQPYQLVEYFVKEDPNLETNEVDEYLSTDKIKYVNIKKPVSLYITYITAWVDKRGFVHFREDIYKRDNISKF